MCVFVYSVFAFASVHRFVTYVQSWSVAVTEGLY